MVKPLKWRLSSTRRTRRTRRIFIKGYQGCREVPMLTRAHSTLPPDTEDVMHRLIGAAIEVHRQLGPGYLESTYHRALCIELRLRGIPFEFERVVQVEYKDELIHGQELDLVVDQTVI